MRLHKGEKPFACEKCPLSFTQFVHLKLHKRLHNNERPFICGSCGKSYISASGLRTHWKTTKCEPSPAEEAITAERSLFLLQQNDPNFLNLKFENHMFKYEHGELICFKSAGMCKLFFLHRFGHKPSGFPLRVGCRQPGDGRGRGEEVLHVGRRGRGPGQPVRLRGRGLRAAGPLLHRDLAPRLRARRARLHSP